MLRVISVLLVLVGFVAVALGGMGMLSGETSRQESRGEMATPPAESAELPAAEARRAPPPPAPAIAGSRSIGTASMRNGPADRLREVPIAHETPDAVTLGQRFEVTLAIDATGADSAARVLPGQGNIVTGEAMVGSAARALLTGANFEIEDLSPEVQTLSGLAANTWRWRVRALAEGRHDLVLEIFAMDGSVALPVRSYRDTVTVQVTTVGRIVKTANELNPIMMLLGGIGSIVGGAFGAFRFFRK